MPMTTVYHPPPVTHYQSSCRWSCFPLLSGPVWLRVYFFFQIFVAVLATFSQLYKALRLRMAAAFVQIWNFLLNHFIHQSQRNNLAHLLKMHQLLIKRLNKMCDGHTSFTVSLRTFWPATHAHILYIHIHIPENLQFCWWHMWQCVCVLPATPLTQF